MIPEITIEKNRAHIPILGCMGETICLKWHEKKHFDKIFEDSWCTLRTNICFDESWRNHVDTSSTHQILHVYEVKDGNTNKDYYLIAHDEIHDIEDLKHCVAITFNRINLIKFYKDYLMTFKDEWIDEE